MADSGSTFYGGPAPVENHGSTRRARRAPVLGAAHDATQSRAILLHSAALRAAVAGDGGCPPCRILRARTRTAVASAAELCAADRAALRHLPHRFCRAHPVRPALQDRRLYLWRRALPGPAISRFRGVPQHTHEE